LSTTSTILKEDTIRDESFQNLKNNSRQVQLNVKQISSETPEWKKVKEAQRQTNMEDNKIEEIHCEDDNEELEKTKQALR